MIQIQGEEFFCPGLLEPATRPLLSILPLSPAYRVLTEKGSRANKRGREGSLEISIKRVLGCCFLDGIVHTFHGCTEAPPVMIGTYYCYHVPPSLVTSPTPPPYIGERPQNHSHTPRATFFRGALRAVYGQLWAACRIPVCGVWSEQKQKWGCNLLSDGALRK